MNTATSEYRTVEDLMRERRTNISRMVGDTHIEQRVVDAIAHQRYTPSPDQRERVSRALDFPRERIVWGHRAAVDEEMHARV
jgi:hypothetical protein